MARKKITGVGNRKGHRTPSPQSLRKIKRINLEAFNRIKILLKEFRQPAAKQPHRIRVKLPAISFKKSVIKQISPCIRGQEHIINMQSSSCWQWRRVVEWERNIINDPLENKNGHMIT